MILIVSLRIHAPLVMVHTKEYVPADVRPVTALLAVAGVVMPAEEVVDQSPDPGAGFDPARVAVPGVEQTT
jgi:hypothetical protein